MADSYPSRHAGQRWIAPRYWPSWLILILARALGRLGHGTRMRIGAAIGRFGYRLAKRRRHIAATNIALCFPGYCEKTRTEIVRAHFENAGRGAVETAAAWWAHGDALDRRTAVTGCSHLEDAALAGRGIILLSAHFTPLALGVRLAQRQLDSLGLTINAMYKAPADPILDRAMQRYRGARMRGDLISHRRVEAVIERLARGEVVWYAGDQKAGSRLGVAADFFGHPVMTHIAICRIAAMTRATVVPFFCLRDDNAGIYRLEFQPALANFPSGDEHADATRMNALIESHVRQAPAQYFWLHRRFRRKDFDPYA